MSGNEVIWTMGVTLDSIERQIILKAIGHYGSKIACANALGRSVRTIDNKLAQYDAEQKAEVELAEAKHQARLERLALARGIRPEIINPPMVANTMQITDLKATRK